MVCSAAMMLVGLTGGVATGKSTVAKMFGQCGAIVIDADELAREVVQPGKPAWREIVRTFGRGILHPDRTIDRHALGAIVFHDKKNLRRLERIIHPRVAREQTKLAKRAEKNDSKAIVIYDVPLLFEAGIDKRVDKIIVVTADRDTQIARLRKRNGLSRSEALRRIRNQLPLAKKRRLAHYILDGTKDRKRLAGEVFKLLEDLRTLR
ncbi:MAG: Dephospho-CoA kinase [Nitrospira sp.]|jgi:dephospho-CoA kinase|nr:MAG: Dephospho-CoA kinase [Nitrospira sp.]